MRTVLLVILLLASLAGGMVGGMALFADQWNGTEPGPGLAKVGWGALTAASVLGLTYAADAPGMIPT